MNLCTIFIVDYKSFTTDTIMKKWILTLIFGMYLLNARSQNCCLHAYTSVTNAPFKCLSDPNTKIDGRSIAEFTVGGQTDVIMTASNGQTQTVNFSEMPQTYGAEVYDFNGKLVKVLTRSVIATAPPGYVSLQTYVVDDGCNVVCTWAVYQPICVTFPCPPANHNSCANPSFFTSASKLDYTPPVGNFVCTGDSITLLGFPLHDQSFRISKNDLIAGGNTYLPTAGGVHTIPEPDHHIFSGAPKPALVYGGGVYVYNGRGVKVYTHTKIQPNSPTTRGIGRLVVVLDEDCNYVGHWQWNQVMCIIAPCYPYFRSSMLSPSFFSTAVLEGGN